MSTGVPEHFLVYDKDEADKLTQLGVAYPFTVGKLPCDGSPFGSPMGRRDRLPCSRWRMTARNTAAEHYVRHGQYLYEVPNRAKANNGVMPICQLCSFQLACLSANKTDELGSPTPADFLQPERFNVCS